MGFLYEKSLLDGGRYCDCTLLQLRLANMDRIWKSLSKATVSPALVKAAPLFPYVRQNLYITASPALFRKHFKAVCFHRSTVWDARVRTDADLLDSWLGTTKLQGKHIFDVEIAEAISLKAVDLPSLLGSFPLMVIVLGVKRLANRESANALLEALNYRQHEELPVWLVDQVDHPITEISHLFYSDHLSDRLREWKHIQLDELDELDAVETTFKRKLSTSTILENVLADLDNTPPPPPSEVKRPPKKPNYEAAAGNEIPGVRLTPIFKKKKPSRL